jgi:drug/metabolite transporter (DMT)-like permease
LASSIEFKAKLACLYAGACWGLFWLPLRALEEAGLHPLWTTVVYFLIPTLCLLPVLFWRWREVVQGGLSFQLTVISSGLALTCYSAAIVYTDVVRAIMLFYLMPIWTTVLARYVLGEAITPARIVAICLAALGLLTIFGLGLSFPVPRNAGDWLGLAAGLFWAITTVRLRVDEGRSSVDLTVGFFIWSLIIASSAALVLAPAAVPSVAQTLPVMPLLLVFMVLFVLPGTYASLWAPKFISPGLVSFLLMTEIVVGAISAALLAGEPFGTREAVGVLLIASASLVEPLVDMHRARSVGG